jgi:glycosyltransferase involved in cell wall biosynthesis
VADNKFGNYILAVGSLDPRKNLNNLIKAFKSCNLNDTKLVIAGSASKIFSDPELKLLLNEDPAITLAGYLTDSELNAAYHHAKLFVYPSLFEGFGLPPLEAMHCGCATIVSDTTSLPEVCADASYYVDPTDSDDIAQAIHRLMRDESLRNALVLKGYKRSKEFNWESSAEKLAQLIKAVS